MTTKLQKVRIRQYFVEAAKSLVIADGVSNVTVRKIAEIAGFSYATIYNYFRDINHLLWHVLMSFIEDTVQFLEPHLGSKPYTLGKIKEIYQEYVRYFLQRPNVLDLIIAHQIGEPPEEFRSYTADAQLAPLLLANLDAPGCRSIGRTSLTRAPIN
jgi:AcrR family transcriptional regulator